jgi:hypothetical protein
LVAVIEIKAFGKSSMLFSWRKAEELKVKSLKVGGG